MLLIKKRPPLVSHSALLMERCNSAVLDERTHQSVINSQPVRNTPVPTSTPCKRKQAQHKRQNQQRRTNNMRPRVDSTSEATHTTPRIEDLEPVIHLRLLPPPAPHCQTCVAGSRIGACSSSNSTPIRRKACVIFMTWAIFHSSGFDMAARTLLCSPQLIGKHLVARTFLSV